MRNVKNFSEYENIIWDFNGTLINDGTLNHKLTNLVLEQKGLLPLSFDEYKEKICFPIPDFYKKINLPYEGEEYDQIVIDWIHLYNEEFLKMPLQENALNLIESVFKSGKREFILSALHQDLLDKAVDTFNIRPFIVHSQGVSKYDGPSKIEEGKDLVSKHNIAPKTTLIIGDTLHDLEVAVELNIDCVLMSHGHQDLESLNKSKAKVLPSFNHPYFKT